MNRQLLWLLTRGLFSVFVFFSFFPPGYRYHFTVEGTERQSELFAPSGLCLFFFFFFNFSATLTILLYGDLNVEASSWDEAD